MLNQELESDVWKEVSKIFLKIRASGMVLIYNVANSMA